MMSNKSQKRLMICVSAFILVSIIGIAYAAFTGQLSISGTGVNRKSNYDIYFNNVSNFLTTGTASVTQSTPTNQSHTTVIEDYEATLISPGDSIYFTFDIVNDGDYDATLTSLTLGPVKCSVNGSETDASATKVCNNITYTMQYTSDNTNVSVNDTLASKETKNVQVTLTYSSNISSSDLPSSNVSISNLGIDMVYEADQTAKTNPNGSTPYEKPTAVSTLLSKANASSVTTYEANSEASHQMYTFSHPATEQTDELTDYRYIGNDPYNYVDFNCDDNGNNCETWRIIGVFTVKNGNKTEQRIKIIRDEKLTDYMRWDSEAYENEWPSATLNTYLNEIYYTSLSNSAKSMIEPAETYLGGRAYDSTIHYGTASDMYSWERGTARINDSRSLNDTKNITLAYPSDYTYTYANGVDSTCYSDGYNCDTSNPSLGWLYKSSYWWWLVSPICDARNAFLVSSYGFVDRAGVSDPDGVRPVAYLISDISFEGNHIGSSTDHYVLKK